MSWKKNIYVWFRFKYPKNKYLSIENSERQSKNTSKIIVIIYRLNFVHNNWLFVLREIGIEIEAENA